METKGRNVKFSLIPKESTWRHTFLVFVD